MLKEVQKIVGKLWQAFRKGTPDRGTAAFGRLLNSGAGAIDARPTVLESMVDGEIDDD